VDEGFGCGGAVLRIVSMALLNKVYFLTSLISSTAK